MKILYLTTVIPYNKKNGGEIVSCLLIEKLRKTHQVIVVGYKRYQDQINTHIDDKVVADRIIESKLSVRHFIFWMVSALLRNKPYSCQKYYSFEYIKTVQNLINKYKFNIIIIEHSQLSWVLSVIPKNIYIVFFSHNVEYYLYGELAKKTTSFLKKIIYIRESMLMRREEFHILYRSIQTLVLSSMDKKYYSKIFNKARITQIDVPGGFFKNFDKENVYDIGLLGTWTWESNKEGLKWFFNKVFPFIDKSLRIGLGGIGSLDYNMKYPNVDTLGFVDNAQLFLASCGIIVIPATAGGGVQVKTLEAISTGKIVITTPIGMRGIDNFPENVVICKNEKEMAEKINKYSNKRYKIIDVSEWKKNREIKFNNIIDNIFFTMRNIC